MNLNNHVRDALLFMALSISLFGTIVTASEKGYFWLVVVSSFSAFIFILGAIVEAIKGMFFPNEA